MIMAFTVNIKTDYLKYNLGEVDNLDYMLIIINIIDFQKK